jgi:hypothetical protein
MDLYRIDPEEKHARNWGMLCHLSGLAGCFMPWIAHLAGPLIIWLLKRNDHRFIDEQGKESLNFQISMALYSVIGGLALAVSIIGLVVLPLFLWSLYVLNVVGVIIASIKTSDGKSFRYPMILRFLK